MASTAIIVAPEMDVHAQVVARRIEALGGRALILDTALYPSEWRLTVWLSDGSRLAFSLEHENTAIDDHQLTGVWWRRPRPHVPSPHVVEAQVRHFIASESRQAFEGWLHCLGDRVINAVSADLTASHKLFQISCAVDLGFPVPATMVTNAPDMVAPFNEATNFSTVFKPFTGTGWQFTGTQRLTSGLFGSLQSVSYAPLIFQEEAKKVADIRVNVIDGVVFAIEIQSKKPQPLLDWRIDPDLDYRHHTLPSHVERGLVSLLTKLGLRFGACDLGLLSNGEYVFFEVNPGGQWLFAEIMTGQEISWAFAKALLRQRHL